VLGDDSARLGGGGGSYSVEVEGVRDMTMVRLDPVSVGDVP
jgi:hypothetical protein